MCFELMDGGDGDAAGGDDMIAEDGRRNAGLPDELGCAQDGLLCEAGSDVMREALLEAAGDDGFDDHIDVGGAGAREGGDGVEEVLFDEADDADG